MPRRRKLRRSLVRHRRLGRSWRQEMSVAATVPTDLAAESLERETVVRADRWLAAPLSSSHRSDGDTEPSHVLLLRGNCSDGVFSDIARSVAEALSIVTRTTSLRRRANRLEAMLAITRKWQQTNDMETLLSEMAEAAIKMFDADRASIFLWDKPNKTIVGTAGARRKGWRAAAGRHGWHRRTSNPNGRTQASHRSGRQCRDRSRRRQTNRLPHEESALRAARFRLRLEAWGVRSAQ